jgi:hypothetical protein
MWLHGPGQMPPGTVLDTARAGRTIEVERAGLTSSASHLLEQGVNEGNAGPKDCRPLTGVGA